MPSPSDDDRSGGRITFAAFMFLGTVWFAASSTTAGGLHVVGVIGLTASIVLGAIVGMMIGFYNFGRERGK